MQIKMEAEKKEELKKQIEAVLFAAGRKVPVDELAKLCRAKPEDVKEISAELKKEYDEKSSPMFLTEELDGYKFTIREKYLSLVKDITPHTELNRAMLETLAVIAWKQPVMQSEVINIRTSKAYEDVKGLVEMGFISKDKHGRSYILKPTGKFFEYFELPSKEAVKEIFKGIKGAEPETQTKIEAGEGGIKKLGELEIFEGKEKRVFDEEEAEETPTPKLGELDVFTEEEEEKKTEEIKEGGESEEAVEETIPEKAAEEKDVPEETSEEEESAEETLEEPEETEEKPKKEKRHRLPKELEQFAGIEEEEEENEKGEGKEAEEGEEAEGDSEKN